MKDLSCVYESIHLCIKWDYKELTLTSQGAMMWSLEAVFEERRKIVDLYCIGSDASLLKTQHLDIPEP